MSPPHRQASCLPDPHCIPHHPHTPKRLLYNPRFDTHTPADNTQTRCDCARHPDTPLPPPRNGTSASARIPHPAHNTGQNGTTHGHSYSDHTPRHSPPRVPMYIPHLPTPTSSSKIHAFSSLSSTRTRHLRLRRPFRAHSSTFFCALQNSLGNDGRGLSGHRPIRPARAAIRPRRIRRAIPFPRHTSCQTTDVCQKIGI